MQENKWNPLIKRILKSFQATAHETLQGPNAITGSTDLSSASLRGFECPGDGRNRPEVDRGLATKAGDSSGLRMLSRAENLRRVLGQKPLLLPVEQSPGALTGTQLEGHRISCFDIEGEKRLCLPQIINCILSYFSLSQINAAYDELRIFTSLCSSGQLDTLKRSHVLPPNAVTCGLITKSNAERLCSYLLRHKSTRTARDSPTVAEDGFRVSHKCFGKGSGFFVTSRYLSASSPAIRCRDCLGMFPPSEFVCHSHTALENHICHWGFDSSRWRSYILLSKNQHITESLQREFEDMKALYVDDHLPCLKQSQSFATNDVANGDNATGSKDRNRQMVSTSNATVNAIGSVPRSSVPKSFSLDSSSEMLSVVQHNEEVNFNPPDNCRNFAPNVSLLPDNFYEKRLQEFCESEDRPTKCLKIEVNFDETNNSPRSFDASEGHIKGEDVCPSNEIEKELSQLFDNELGLFREVLEQEESLPLEARKKMFDNYILIQKRFQATVDRLIHRQRKLQKELFYVHRKVSDTSDQFSSLHETHANLLSQLRIKFGASVKSSNDENDRLKTEIDMLTNARKRSDCGLMKAKYKAQMELFRRKCQSVDQSNKELISKCIELRKLLTDRCNSACPSANQCDVSFT